MINLNLSAMQKIVQKKFGLEKYINIKKYIPYPIMHFVQFQIVGKNLETDCFMLL